MAAFEYRPRPIRLLDQTLTLSPETQRIMAEIQAQIAAREWLDRLRNPAWATLMPLYQSWLSALPPMPNLQLPGPWASPPDPRFGPAFWRQAQPSPTPQPVAGPSTPHPGEVQDVLRAVYALPVIQSLTMQARDRAMGDLGRLGREFTSASTGQKVMMISVGTIFAAGLVTPILYNQTTRRIAFDLIKDKDIPIPFATGFTFRLMDNGGGAGFSRGSFNTSASLQLPASGPRVNAGLSLGPVSASGNVQANGGGPLQYGATITVDLAQLLPGSR